MGWMNSAKACIRQHLPRDVISLSLPVTSAHGTYLPRDTPHRIARPMRREQTDRRLAGRDAGRRLQLNASLKHRHDHIEDGKSTLADHDLLIGGQR